MTDPKHDLWNKDTADPYRACGQPAADGGYARDGQAYGYSRSGSAHYRPYGSPQYADTTPEGKNKWIAALLAFFVGGLGIHKFYLGKTGAGIVYLVFCWTGIPAIVAFIESIVYLCTDGRAFAEKYRK